MKSSNILFLLFVFLLLPGCGGGGGSSSSSSSSNSSSSQLANVLLLTVNGSTCDSSIGPYINEPCVSVTVCTPGTSACVTINGILLDTGSYGLRIFKQALGSVPLTQVTSGSGSLAECVQYADGTSDWGPVQMANVILGNEQAVQVPIQVIESTFGAIPASCGPSGGYTPDQSPSDTGFNGILGVGPFVQDCGSTCVNSSVGQYYTCLGSNCSGTTVPLSNQVSNPVASLPTDNNGLIVEIPTVAAGGAASVSGSLVLGIGTQSNNSPSGVTVYSVDQNGEFTTTFSGVTYADVPPDFSGSFIDTGSNGLYFPTPTSGTYNGELPDCNGDNAGFFCPPVTNSNPDGVTSLSAAITGASGSPTGTVTFSIGNFSTLIRTGNNVFSNIGGNSPGFDWGLPFYFGRNVFIGIEGTPRSSLGTGPYFAF